MEQEIWKDIEGYEGLYQVSNFGNIKSLDRKVLRKNNKIEGFWVYKGKNIKKNKGNNGYYRVNLHKDGNFEQKRIHQLVANAFLEKKDFKYCDEIDKLTPLCELKVNHKDENKLNNYVGNLEWCTNKYNVTYGNAREKHDKKLKKTILQYDKKGNFIKKWESARDASRNLKISEGCISGCGNNRRKSAGGYVWRYENVGSNF